MTIILMALPQESDGLIEKIAHAHGIQVYYTGIGLIAASQKATEVICAYKPTQILNLGTAGSRRIAVGQVVECTQFSNRTPNLLNLLNYTISVQPLTNLQTVHCASADHVETGEGASSHEIMDMEAFAIAAVCKKMNVKFNAIKYITDTSQADVVTKWREQVRAAAQALQKVLENLIQTKVLS